MNEPSLADALAAIIKPIVKEAVREALTPNLSAAKATGTEKPFLTIKQAAEASGLGVSTIRLYVRRRQLRAQQVGRRVLVKRSDLDQFLESNPIEVKPD